MFVVYRGESIVYVTTKKKEEKFLAQMNWTVDEDGDAINCYGEAFDRREVKDLSVMITASFHAS